MIHGPPTSLVHSTQIRKPSCTIPQPVFSLNFCSSVKLVFLVLSTGQLPTVRTIPLLCSEYCLQFYTACSSLTLRDTWPFGTTTIGEYISVRMCSLDNNTHTLPLTRTHIHTHSRCLSDRNSILHRVWTPNTLILTPTNRHCLSERNSILHRVWTEPTRRILFLWHSLHTHSSTSLQLKHR